MESWLHGHAVHGIGQYGFRMAMHHGINLGIFLEYLAMDKTFLIAFFGIPDQQGSYLSRSIG